MRHLLLMCAVILFFGGCKSDRGSQARPSSVQTSAESSSQIVDTSSDGVEPSSACNLYREADAESDRIKLQESKARWESMGLDAYEFRYMLSSTRFPPITFTPAIVVVSGGSVTEVYDVETGEYIDPLDYPRYAIRTVDEWFDRLENLIDSAVGGQLALSFNTEYGYPALVDVDFAPCGGFDGASTYSLTNLQ